MISLGDDEWNAHHDSPKSEVSTFTLRQESCDEYFWWVIPNEPADTDIVLSLQFIDDRLTRSDSARVVVGVDVYVNVTHVVYEFLEQWFKICPESFNIAGKTAKSNSFIFDDTHYLIDGNQVLKLLTEPWATE